MPAGGTECFGILSSRVDLVDGYFFVAVKIITGLGSFIIFERDIFSLFIVL